MRWGLLGFVAGATSVTQLAALPPVWTCFSLLAALILALAIRFGGARSLRGGGSLPSLLVALAAFCAGLSWAVLHAEVELQSRLPGALNRTEIELLGTVVGVVQQAGPAHRPILRFNFEPDAWPRFETEAGWHRWREGLTSASTNRARRNASFWQDGLRSWRGACRLRVSWYDADTPVRAGSRWLLRLRLRVPNGTRNEHGSDREAWLLTNRICASAYIKTAAEQSALTTHLAGVLARWREGIADWLARQIQHRQAAALAQALAVGVRTISMTRFGAYCSAQEPVT